MSTSPLHGKKGRFVVDDTIGSALIFASEFLQKKDDYVIVANNQYSAEKIYNFLLNFLSEEDVVFFPSDELLRAEAISSGRELLSQRLYALDRLLDPRKKILVCHPSSLLRYLPSPKDFSAFCLDFAVGEEHSLSKIKARLVDMGYQGVNKVDHSLQFASRGDILDIYSVSYLNPVRIEFFGDEIESIRLFDIGTQQSKQELKSVRIIPATDIFLTDEQLSDFAARAREQLDADKKLLDRPTAELLEQNVSLDLEDFVNRNYKPSLYKYFGYAAGSTYSVLDYIKAKAVYIANEEAFDSAADLLIREAQSYFLELRLKGRLLSHLEEYIQPEKVFQKQKVLRSNAFITSPDDFIFQVSSIVTTGRSLASVVPTIQIYLANDGKVVLSLKERQQYQTVTSLLDDAKLPYEDVEGFNLPEGNLGITRSFLNEGFYLPKQKLAYISPSEIFGRKSASSRFTGRFQNATILRSYEDLHPGDYVVHEYNGIGQYLGIKTIEVDGIHRDYLHIAYAGNEFLYVPLEQFRLVRKYAGREGAAPALSHLYSGDWEKKKAKIKKRVNELAERLIALYGERASIKGFAFPPDDELQMQFEGEFPYELTPDQQTSLDEIKADMEEEEAMDRLLCGDVGFGKTEIAFRAAFKAISAGKQVALLCPTTLLARQHYEVALQRFAGYGIKIAPFSRLIPPSEQKRDIDLIEKGKIDLAIGTHRLLSKDFHFKDLGLLIVDEEQRFGVEQKERIKELKTNVDVLTLSATPIPRTMQMSLVGIRQLSQINTAPNTRQAVQTYVTPFKQEVVNELIQRELTRGGQVFYIHNRVDSIYAVASRLENAVKGSAVGVVHGKMDKEMVEEVMGRFYEGEINVLVATSIVENGIDVPNANLIIVEDADKFGLSQLYQIKGRVGRGDRIAYAYLMYREKKEMNEDAVKRLKAIQEFTELGSGYKIAQRDLMIRGAGDILGPEQAGFIDSIGLDLYLKMLNEAVAAKKEGKESEPPKAAKLFKIDAYIPGDYANESDKISMYQELQDIKDAAGLREFEKKTKDIYGKIPEQTKLLLQKKRIDLIAEKEEFSSMDEGPDYVDLVLSDSFTRIPGMGSELFDALIDYIDDIKISFINKRLKIRMNKRGKWADDLEKILNKIDKLYLKRAEQK